VCEETTDDECKQNESLVKRGNLKLVKTEMLLSNSGQLTGNHYNNLIAFELILHA
jgi:hypothetical protein